MWKKGWFNLLILILYTSASFGLAALFSPRPEVVPIFGGALAYGCANVHFVLWFTFYTRERKEAQHGVGAEGRDELGL